MALPAGIARGLAVPLIAAPMTQVSGVDLVVAACRNGVIGSFPTHNASQQALPLWLERIRSELDAARAASNSRVAPFAANLIVHASNRRRDHDVAVLVESRVDIVITSVGSPAPVVGPLQEAGCLVLADVASMRHVDRALDLGVDGLILLSAGAGGQTGWLNPLAFVRAVRDRYDGPVVLAGGIADGAALAAATIAGADLAYMGTRFIATVESAASGSYKTALLGAGPDDIRLTTSLTGLQANVLDRALAGSGSGSFEHARLVELAETDVWSAGHSVCGVASITDVATLVHATRAEYLAALGR